jgi:bacterioferritin-associated ferredoxin
MYVCHCRAVTDHTIDGEVERGADTVEELAARCGAGSECGGCWPALEELIERHARDHQLSRTLATAHR